MTPQVPSGPRHSFHFALPPSLGNQTARERAERLVAFLQRALGKLVEVSVAPSYETLAKDLLSGRADAAWAPPFVCARMEAMGVRVVVRGRRWSGVGWGLCFGLRWGSLRCSWRGR